MLGRTVGELLDSVSYPELMEWVEFLQVDPDPEWRADARSAQICTILANVNRDTKQRPQPYGMQDFMLFDKLAEAKKAQAPAEEAAAPAKAGGAKIAPETVSWLFAMSRKGKKLNG